MGLLVKSWSLDEPASLEITRSVLTVRSTEMQADPKKLGKEKKPDRHLVSLVFLKE